MAYYRGDYYMGAGGRGIMRGDYYRGKGMGDPFWGALWTGIKAVGGALLGVRPAAQTQAAAAQAAGGLSGVQMATRAGEIARRTITGPGGVMTPHQPIPLPESMKEMIDRSGLIPSRRIGQAQLVATPAGPMVIRRRRRMNPANSRALGRAIRRVVGFGRLASRSRRAIGKAATALQIHRRPAAKRRR